MEKGVSKQSGVLTSRALVVALVVNNLKVVGIHTAIILMASFVMLMLSFQDWVNVFAEYILAPTILILYVLTGYLLRALPKYNFISVVGLPILFLLLFYILPTLVPVPILGIFVFYNMPAFAIVDMLYSTFMGAGEVDVPTRWVHFVALLLPSLCMYLGLCLKVRSRIKVSRS